MSSALFHMLPVLLALTGVLLGVAAFSARASARLGIPTALVFIALGMVLGRQPELRSAFEGYDVLYIVGNIALSLILFYGGLCTDLRRVKGVWWPAVALATVGVLGVSLLTGAVAWLIVPGITFSAALILGAVLGSTDAASVLQILGGERIAGRVKETVELESGLNDPMAFILVATFTAMSLGDGFSWMVLPEVLWKLVGGAFMGVFIGWVAMNVTHHIREDAPESYPVRTLAVALLAYGVAESLHASGLLAVFMSALYLRNSRGLPYSATLVRFHATLAYLAQIVMFVALGFVVNPAVLVEVPVALGGTVLAIVLALLARPVVVTAVLAPFGFPAREVAGIAWLGLRGAVPVILMTIPLIAAADNPGAAGELEIIFKVVFFAVIVGNIIPGATVRWVMRLLRLRLPPVPQASASIDIVTARPMDATLVMLPVHHDSPIAGKTLADAKLPGEVTVALLVRNGRAERVRGDTVFEVGDEVALAVPDRMLGVVHDFFGHAQH